MRFHRSPKWLLVVSLTIAAALTVGAKLPTASAQDFFQPAKDKGASLPADEIYPRGRIFPFGGYSGKPEREKAAGFSMTGPSYGGEKQQLAALEAAEKAGLKYPYMVGLPMQFTSKDPTKVLRLSEDEIRQRVTEQVKKVVDRKGVCWWYMGPEELRNWHKNEMDYLRVVSETIRKLDPQKRPLWMYEPNHRDATALAKTGQYQDIIGKGFYVNSAGFKNNRLWVRWGIEQEVAANGQLGGNHTCLIMPELCKDPPAEERPMIASWVRHDIYLGLMHGGQGVMIWSLFKRPAVRETYNLWYNAYSDVARQLCGPLGLGQVFLFGEDRHDLRVNQLAGDATSTFNTPKEIAEAGSLSEREKKARKFQYPPLSTREIQYGDARYLFICNSQMKPIKVNVSGFPVGCHVKELLQNRDFAASSTDAGTLTGQLGAWDVRCLKFTK